MAEPHTDYFGLCPECSATDGYVNTGKSHVFICKKHKKRWTVGSNLFSSWREETEAEQRLTWDELGLEDFEDITGRAVYPVGTAPTVQRAQQTRSRRARVRPVTHPSDHPRAGFQRHGPIPNKRRWVTR